VDQYLEGNDEDYVIVGFMLLLGHRVDKHKKTSLRKVRIGGYCNQKQDRSAVSRDISLKYFYTYRPI
jgi:hypothetical protein